jgi:hypothetical protein
MDLIATHLLWRLFHIDTNITELGSEVVTKQVDARRLQKEHVCGFL